MLVRIAIDVIRSGREGKGKTLATNSRNDGPVGKVDCVLVWAVGLGGGGATL